MKNILAVTAIAAVLMCGRILAQSTNPSSTAPSSAGQAQSANEPRIAPGSVIPVQLTKTVDAKKAKTGDEVVAKGTQDMKTNTGEVLVPKDTKVIGHVTEAQARHKAEKESQLAIAFDQAVLKNEQVQLPMSIQAVIGQQNNNNNDNSTGTPAGEPMPSSAGTPQSSPMGGRSPMGNTGQPQAPTSAPDDSSGAQQQGNKLPPINAKTQGVIGISNLTLSPASNGAQGSVLSSEKHNVRLESGTMLLLRVNQ